jgi:hypothetical protein
MPIIKFLSGFEKKIKKFNKKEKDIIFNKISEFQIKISNPKFRKHKLN